MGSYWRSLTWNLGYLFSIQSSHHSPALSFYDDMKKNSEVQDPKVPLETVPQVPVKLRRVS